ncbi:MAG: zinc ABC transporter substrate-binding protein [Sulfitobacter sp.]
MRQFVSILAGFGAASFGVASLLATSAAAQVPQVMTDIAPVHGIVARVMDGVGEAELLFGADVSPHHAALRPSQARALSQADLVVWMGPGLAPQLESVIGGLSGSAAVMVLPQVPGTNLLPIREGALFEHSHAGHDHGGHAGEAEHEAHEEHEDHEGHDHEGHDHEGHEDHGDEDHGEHEKHEEHAGHDHGDDHGHDHGHDHGAHAPGSMDPHSWLDPDNARIWALAISDELARLDPENAAQYAQNAQGFRDELKGLMGSLSAELAPAADTGFVVLHDATQYFEHRFDLQATAAISASDAQSPSLARMTALREALAGRGNICAFSEPQPGDKLVRTAGEGLTLRQAELDPLGLGIEPGPQFYGQLIAQMGASFVGCLLADS